MTRITLRVLTAWAGFALLAGCSSVEWQQPPSELPTEWRGRRLFAGPDGDVLAANSSSAADAHERLAGLAAEIAETAGQPPGRFLAVVEEDDDEPLFDDPTAAVRQRGLWQAAVLGEGPPDDEALSRLPDGLDLQTPEGEPIELDVGRLARLVAIGVPRDDTVLGLPAELVARAAWIVLLPSDDCVDAVGSELLDAKLRSEGFGFLKRAALKSAIALSGLSLVEQWWEHGIEPLWLTAWVAGMGGSSEAAHVAWSQRRHASDPADEGPAEPEREFIRPEGLLSINHAAGMHTLAWGEHADAYATYTARENVLVVDLRADAGPDLGHQVEELGGRYQARKLTGPDGLAAEADARWLDSRLDAGVWLVVIADRAEHGNSLFRSWTLHTQGQLDEGYRRFAEELELQLNPRFPRSADQSSSSR